MEHGRANTTPLIESSGEYQSRDVLNSSKVFVKLLKPTLENIRDISVLLDIENINMPELSGPDALKDKVFFVFNVAENL